MDGTRSSTAETRREKLVELLHEWTVQLSLVTFVAFAVAPFVIRFYTSFLLTQFFAYVVILAGFNLLLGYTGLLSFGHAFFVAMGAYSSAFLATTLGLPYLELMLLIAVLGAVVLAGLIGYLVVRYTEIYFAMLTLAFGMLLYSFTLRFSDITGGSEGIDMPRAAVLGMQFESLSLIVYQQVIYYYVAFLLAVIAILAMWVIVNSPFGLTLRTIRDNEDKARFLGINVERYRLYAFIIAGVYGAVGGVILAPPIGQITPSLSHWTHSGDIVFMALLGGFRSFVGPLIGAFVFVFLTDTLKSATSFWRLVLGVILAVIIVVAPQGLWGLVRDRFR